jgi:hypothetical protein
VTLVPVIVPRRDGCTAFVCGTESWCLVCFQGDLLIPAHELARLQELPSVSSSHRLTAEFGISPGVDPCLVMRDIGSHRSLRE